MNTLLGHRFGRRHYVSKEDLKALKALIFEGYENKWLQSLDSVNITSQKKLRTFNLDQAISFRCKTSHNNLISFSFFFYKKKMKTFLLAISHDTDNSQFCACVWSILFLCELMVRHELWGRNCSQFIKRPDISKYFC